MLPLLWDALILLCCIAVITHPTKEGVLIGSIFLISVFLPEVLITVGFVDQWYFSACFMAITLSMCLLQGNYTKERLANSFIKLLMFAELPLNVVGIFIEENHWDITLSNYLYYTLNINPALDWVNNYQQENWLYMFLAIVNYTIALYLLYDREGRKQNVGFGITHLLGFKFMSFNLGRKGMERCQK